MNKREVRFYEKAKRRRFSREYIPAPEINNLDSLIEISQSKIKYSNINIEILWQILPELQLLNDMIGMENLKETIFYQIIYYLQDLHTVGQNEYLHTVILGPPGCGKTTVAKIIGEIYKKMKILSPEGTFKVAKREDFVGEYLGQTAAKTKRLLNSCLGGVLFIDEAYALGPGQKDKDSFSKEAIDTLNAFLSENKENFCCIIAGYEEEVKKCFFSVNPGLERRFQWIHKINDYSEKDLANILIKMINENSWNTVLNIEEIIKLIKDNIDLFKNSGGDIENFLTKSKLCHAKRVFSLDPKYKLCLTKDDFKNAINMMNDNKLVEQEKDEPNPSLYL